MAESITLTVNGMKCGGCESNVSNKLLALDGVHAVNASHQQKSITIEYDPDVIDLGDLEDTIADAGFLVE